MVDWAEESKIKAFAVFFEKYVDFYETLLFLLLLFVKH